MRPPLFYGERRVSIGLTGNKGLEVAGLSRNGRRGKQENRRNEVKAFARKGSMEKRWGRAAGRLILARKAFTLQEDEPNKKGAIALRWDFSAD